MVRIKKTLSYGATDTAKSATLNENGFVRAIAITQPNWTTAATAVITVGDTDSVTLYTSAGQTENTTQVLTGLTIPIDYNYTVTVTLNDVAGGAGGDVTISLYVERV